MATATDDNAADEKSDKSIWQLLNIRCTRYDSEYDYEQVYTNYQLREML